MDGFGLASALLPEDLRAAAEGLSTAEKRSCEEFRLRRSVPAAALIGGREKPLSSAVVTEEQLRGVLETATRSSLHASEDALRRGYISAAGGVRVGVCGVGVMGPEGVSGLRSFSSLAIRVPRQVPGCADGIWEELTTGGFRSLLVVSPPGAGKTTLLREIIRRLSYAGDRICVADERGELAGFGAGGGFDVGPHTDVMTGIPKAEAAEMLLRSMGPQTLAMDEIADEAEGAALLRAVNCGVTLLASVHGRDRTDAGRRPACRALLRAGAFERCVTVSCRDGVRRYFVEKLP